MEDEFDINDIVWAKVKNYPWWPGLIAGIMTKPNNELKYTINFIGENSHAVVNQNNIMQYDNFYKEYSKTEDEVLKASIIKANEIKLSRVFEGCEETNLIKEEEKQEKRYSIKAESIDPVESALIKEDIKYEETGIKNKSIIKLGKEIADEIKKEMGSEVKREEERKIPNSVRKNYLQIRDGVGTFDMSDINKKIKESGIEGDYKLLYIPIRVPKANKTKCKL